MSDSSATPLELLYDDEHLVVVAKPAGMLVVPAAGRGAGADLVSRLGAQLGQRLHAVHRLDEDTTGALCVARSLPAREALEQQVFRCHAAQRTYLALVSAVPQPRAGRLESRLAVGRDGVVRSVIGGSGERAVTHYRFVERRGRHALVVCNLETGRRNQIRAHLSELGVPIVGDRKHGWRAAGGGLRPARPLLHAWRLAFRHPITGEELDLRCAAPEPELVAPADLTG